MQNQSEGATLLTLAAAQTLVTDIIMEVAGNDISNHFDGSPITRETINGLTQAVINNELGEKHS